jgi:glycosyltransferase involved in cell wall biosynthesis
VNILMLSGDTALARGQDGPFNQMLRLFSTYWERVDVLCPRASGAEARTVHGNVHLHPSPLPALMQPFFILRQGRRLFNERHYDLVISHDYGVFYNGIGAWLLTAGSEIPYISEIHHIEGHPFALTRRELLYRWLANAYLRTLAKRARAIRTVNRTEVPEYLRRQDVPQEKILILPSLYLDFQTFHPMPDEPCLYDVLFVGRLVSNKGLLNLLDALAKVKKTHPDVKLGILGEGPLLGTLNERIAALGLNDNVTFLPRAETMHDLAKIYNQTKMLVCASTSEGGPRVTVEAMACRTAVISTPVGIMRDLMESGLAFIVSSWGADSLAAKITLLLEDELLREQVAENGEIAVQGFRADHIIDQYARAYRDLVQS